MKPSSIARGQNLADLAVTHAGASRVFHRHGLDYCCNGMVSLEESCGSHGLAVDALIEEIQGEERVDQRFVRWDEASLESLIDHILIRFHEAHRAEVPRLVAMARKVENEHADKASCPSGLTEHLERMQEALELHMQKEEQVLFPLLRSGLGHMTAAPIQAMEEEHREHGENLARLRELAHGYQPPEEACATWRALYLGLAEIESELMQHIHLENNVLFPKAQTT